MPDFDPTSPFTRAQALAAGVTDGQLRGPRFRRVFPNAYISAAAPLGTELRARAALLLAPDGALVARATAAELLGGVVPHDTRVHLSLNAGRMRVAGIEDRCRSGRRGRARMRGVPVTTAEDTFVDLVADLGLADLVVLGDSLVAKGRTTPKALVAAAATVGGKRSELARRAAGLVREGVDSPMESRLRLLLVLAGLTEPVVNHIEYDERGWWKRRYDLSFPECRLAIEYDGRQHADSSRQWERDVERREELDVEDWRIVVVLSKGIYREPERTLGRVVTAMRDRGMPAMITSQEWHLHFPGHPRSATS